MIMKLVGNVGEIHEHSKTTESEQGLEITGM